MSDRSKLLALEPPTDADESRYEIGYGKPPQRTRFKPGQSGNPRGRPKGAKNKVPVIPADNEERLNQVILEEAYRYIDIRDGDQKVSMPVIQAIVRNMALNAAKGNQRAQRLFTDMLQSIERDRKALADEWLKTAIEYKVEWEHILAEREKTGRTGPRPYPHPDDIVVNMATGNVDIRGPITKEEGDYLEVFAGKVNFDGQIADLEKEVNKGPEDRALKTRLQTLHDIRDRVIAHLRQHPGSGRFIL